MQFGPPLQPGISWRAVLPLELGDKVLYGLHQSTSVRAMRRMGNDFNSILWLRYVMNPYENLPEQHFWKTGVWAQKGDIGPRVQKTLTIPQDARISTAGSCFAQNLAKHLLARNPSNFHTTEALRDGDPVFSARFGNIYTAHQLLQLFQEAMGGAADGSCAIQRADGRYVDVFRPFVEPDGFDDADAVVAARQVHLQAVKTMFLETNVFVFTLGLTETWQSTETDRVFPVAPGVYSVDAVAEFRNFELNEIQATMETFLDELAKVNRDAQVLLTVSPVPLTATYTQDHVLVATMHSKSILRVVCSQVSAKYANAFYFPSYEMISNPYSGESAYEPDNMRTIKSDHIARVMRFFEDNYLAQDHAAPASEARQDLFEEDAFCDEVEIEKSVGF